MVKGDEHALRLVKSTGAGTLGGATAPPLTDGGRPARRASRLVPVKGGQYPHGGVRQSALSLGPRWSAFTTPWRLTQYPTVTNIPQAAERNACLGSRQQPAGAAAGSAATSPQLWEEQDQHRAEQAAQVAQPGAPSGRHVCRTAGRLYHHPYGVCAWTLCANCKWVGHTQRECTRDLISE